MRGLCVIVFLVTCSQTVFAQGAILESLDDLRGTREPPVYRGAAPERVDISSKLPAVRSQRPTSSCVSWAATYAAASFALRARGVAPAITLSPSFTYNQIARDQWCGRGTAISATLNLLRDAGALPIEQFAFDAGWCGRQPTAEELSRANAFRITSWAAFDARSHDKVKQQLARGAPVIFATHWTRKMGDLRGDAVLEGDDTPGEGHAMLVVGYDDSRRALLVQNSFGSSWGNRGYGWFGYDWWKRNVRAAYVIE